MNKEYLTFVTNMEDLKEGQEVKLTIRDLTPGPRKYEARVVKARVFHSPQPQALDTLWVRSWTGVLYPQPWAIQIVEEVGECEPGLPHGDMMKGKVSD